MHSSTVAQDNERLLTELKGLESAKTSESRASTNTVSTPESANRLDPGEIIIDDGEEEDANSGVDADDEQQEKAALERQVKKLLMEQKVWRDEIQTRDTKVCRMLDIHDGAQSVQIEELESRIEQTRLSELPSTTGSGMTVYDRQHMRSVQQKLEQLVAVHRQLLRKYASLELELGESKKRLALRDDRIKQLEGNTRMLAGNMRAQAERHVQELSRLRDQVSQLQDRQAGAASGDRASSDLGAIRPIRGGGRRIPAASQVAPPTRTPAHQQNFLSRIFSMGN